MKEYKLNIDPRILELLGPSLYTNIYYVLAELIANAYDADAKNVYIIANPDDITVEDDGRGMSYERGDIGQYLNVGRESRTTEDQAITTNLKRRKMGRKGVGKLAALSVSENVLIKTKCGPESSGFILSRHPQEGNHLTPIPDEKVALDKVIGDGSSIVMQNPQYRLHVSLDAITRNILKIFPLVDQDFRIHVIRGKDSRVIERLDEGIVRGLGTIITLGESFAHLVNLVPEDFPERRNDLIKAVPTKSIPVSMKDRNDQEHEYNIEINGWIGTYKSTRGRKAERSDFPDNFISLFSNKKLGEFNILPAVGQNKLNEVYVVGQLHIDLFELTELPDMALSNRQGYKSDDPRYERVMDYVRSNLLADILKMREVYTDIKNATKNQAKLDEQRKKEEQLKKEVDRFRDIVVSGATDKISSLSGDLGQISKEKIQEAISSSINDGKLNLGLKKEVDSLKKRILISQTIQDKPLADVVYQMLCHNGVPPEDILYTNCDDEMSRIPEGRSVYEYLRDFFVKSYSSEMIFVVFVTSDNTKQSWGAIAEVGAAWITQVESKIFNIHPFRPEHPLDDETLWQTTNRDETSKELWMLRMNGDIFCQKIEYICKKLGYSLRERTENISHLATLVSIHDRI